MPDALMVTSSFLPGRGGIESFLAELCDLMAPRLAVLAPGRRDGKPIPSDLAYPAKGYSGPTPPVPGRGILRRIEATAAEYGTRKILFGTPWPLALVGPALRKRGLRYAVIVHGAELIVPAAVPGLGALVARAMASADLLLPVSAFTGAKLSELLQRHHLPVPPIELLRARVDLDRFRPGIDAGAMKERLGLHDQDKTVLCFGRLVRRKGVHRLIAALPEIRSRVPEVVVVVAGTGPEERRLRKLARATDCRVVFAGRVPDDEAPACYALADVFVLPVVDRYRGLEVEGLGVVLLEAAASATPCVTGRSGGTPEAVLDGITGFVIDASDQEKLGNAIVRLLTDPELATTMGVAGRHHVAAEFSSRALPTALTAWLSERLP